MHPFLASGNPPSSGLQNLGLVDPKSCLCLPNRLRFLSGAQRKNMSTAAFVFMIATYWTGGSGPMEGGTLLANGQRYRKEDFIAAHRTLPFGTILHVCLRRQCVSVVVKDRGPFLPKMDPERRIDLSYAAAKALDMLHDGRQRVRVSVPTPKSRPDIAGLHEARLD